MTNGISVYTMLKRGTNNYIPNSANFAIVAAAISAAFIPASMPPSSAFLLASIPTSAALPAASAAAYALAYAS